MNESISLMQNEPGFSWDSNKQSLVADEQAWMKAIQVNVLQSYNVDLISDHKSVKIEHLKDIATHASHFTMISPSLPPRCGKPTCDVVPQSLQDSRPL